MAVKRIEVLGVPVDVCSPVDFEEEIIALLEKEGSKQIVFLSIWGLLKARGHNDFAECVRNADLILPISKSILSGAKFLKQDVPHRWNPFTTLIDIMSFLESRYKSVYFLGGRKKMLLDAEYNVHMTFKTLQVVGRYVGYYPKNEDDAVISAIHKASPSLVVLSEGLKDKDCWYYHRKEKFENSIFLYYNDAVGIFSKRRSHVSKKTFDMGLEIWGEIFKNPFKLFLFFPYLFYKINLLWYRLFRM